MGQGPIHWPQSLLCIHSLLLCHCSQFSYECLPSLITYSIHYFQFSSICILLQIQLAYMLVEQVVNSKASVSSLPLSSLSLDLEEGRPSPQAKITFLFMISWNEQLGCCSSMNMFRMLCQISVCRLKQIFFPNSTHIFHFLHH